MFDGVEVAPFEIENSEDIKRHVARLVDENSKLKIQLQESRQSNSRDYPSMNHNKELLYLRNQL